MIDPGRLTRVVDCFLFPFGKKILYLKFALYFLRISTKIMYVYVIVKGMSFL